MLCEQKTAAGFDSGQHYADCNRSNYCYSDYFGITCRYGKGKTFYGISNVGVKPTVEVPFAGVETYLFDCDEDLYGEEARVEFHHFVRPECKFDSVEELKAQIQRDAGSGKRYFEKRGLHY